MASDTELIDPAWAWAPYEPDRQQPWNAARAAHLYRRAGFAATSGQLRGAVSRGPAEVVEELLHPGDTSRFDTETVQLAESVLAAGDVRSLPAWWLYRMLHSPDQLREKATLFWHGHFATSGEKVQDARLMLRQNELLRAGALGSFEELVQQISRDPAMLIYLDSTTNRKLHPNENYAREVMELFCLGLGNYTEQDIQQIARCFTGWEVRRGRFYFDRYQHDDGTKAFLGQRGRFNGEDAVRIIVGQPAAPRFIARKLIRYFVFDEPEPAARLVEPLAQELEQHQFRIAPVLRRIFTSRLFYSEHAIGRKVRSPVELAIGLLRALEGQANLVRLARSLADLGQLPFFPPNVKGWDGGRSWINSSTLLGRANLVRQLVTSPESRFAGADLEQLVAAEGLSSPEEVVDWLLELLVAVPIPAATRRTLADLGRQAAGSPSQKIAKVIIAIGSLPEFQLA